MVGEVGEEGEREEGKEGGLKVSFLRSPLPSLPSLISTQTQSRDTNSQG